MCLHSSGRDKIKVRAEAGELLKRPCGQHTDFVTPADAEALPFLWGSKAFSRKLHKLKKNLFCILSENAL